MKYIINKYTFQVIEVQNPDDLHESGYTNFDFAWLSLRESDRANWVVQDTLPNVLQKYWKVVSDEIVAMNQSEIDLIDQQESELQAQNIRNQKIAQNKAFGYALFEKVVNLGNSQGFN